MANKSDNISFSAIADDDVSGNAHHALQAFVNDEHYMNQDIHYSFQQSQQNIEAYISFTGSHPTTSLSPYDTYTSPPQFKSEGLTADEWAQHFASTDDYVQISEKDEIVPSVGNSNGNIISDLNTVRHDIPTHASPTAPLHGGTVRPTPTLHEATRFPEPTWAFNDVNSMPSSTVATIATTSRTSSPPNSQGHNPNVSGSPYHCGDCGTLSKTKRDHERHLKTKKHQKKTSNGNDSGSASTAVTGFHCLAPDCEYSLQGGKTFTREDNIWRHMKNVHSTKAKA